jgi:hypothetical protein
VGYQSDLGSILMEVRGVDELNQSSGNPYAHIDNEAEDGQGSIFSHGPIPGISTPKAAGAPTFGEPNGGRGSARFDLELYASALRVIPSGNPNARAPVDDHAISSAENLNTADADLSGSAPAIGSSNGVTFSNPYRHIDNSSSEAQPYFEVGASKPWESSFDRRRPTNGSRAWARQFTSRADLVGRPRKGHSDQEIEELARSIHQTLWEQRSELFGGTDDPIQVLNPEKVLELCGYAVRHRRGGLGHDKQAGVMVDVAGLIDPASKVVEISMLMLPTERLFTLAHELGHVVLGTAGTVVHRDRPLNGTRTARDFDERSADKFAAYFLMPRKPLKQLFEDCYLTDCFKLTEETGFALRASSLDVVQKDFPTLRKLSCYLATAEHYNGRGFRSLASIFKVSEAAMAIRLEELGLVK